MKNRRWLLVLATSIICMGTSLNVMAEGNDEDVSGQLNYSNGTLYISTAEELVTFASQVNEGTISSEINVELSADINLTGTEFSSIKEGSGTFNGNNHTITLDEDSLFIEIDNMVITYLKLDGYVEVDSGSAAALAETATDSSLTYVQNKASITNDGNGYVGGLIAKASGCTITSCYNSGTIVAKGTSESYAVGGIVGSCESISGSQSSAVNLISCGNSGSISSYGSPLGGIVGYSSTGIFSECSNEGSIVQYGGSDTSIGGIVGEFISSMDNKVDDHVVSCTNSGSVSNANGNAGGIVGYANGQEIEECSNTGSITGNVAGGILGLAGESTTAVTNVTSCDNSGSVMGYTSAAGIIGQSSNASINTGSTSVDTVQVELAEIDKITAIWNDGDISVDLTSYTTNTSDIGGSYSLSTNAPSTISMDGSKLVVRNDSTSATEVGTYDITVYFTVNGKTVSSDVNITILSRDFVIGDFRINNILMTSEAIAELTASVTYDGTVESIEKEVNSDIWSEDDYTVTYAFDTDAWMVTMTITPITDGTNASEDSESLVSEYSVLKRALVQESLTTTTSYTFPMDLAGEQTTVSKNGETDGCVYESDITFYTSEGGEYTYSAASEVQ